MRQLRKTRVNVVNAELYAVEPTVNKDGRKLTSVSIVSSYRPYTPECRTNCSVGYNRYAPSAESRIFEMELAKRSAEGYCGFEFIYNDHYYGWVQTPYHLEGKCLGN